MTTFQFWLVKARWVLEILEQLPDVDAMVIPVGGGDLLAGTALAIKTLAPHVKVIVSIPLIITCAFSGHLAQCNHPAGSFISHTSESR